MLKSKPYIIGFVFSVLLTLAAYLPVWQHVSSEHIYLSHEHLVLTVVIIAVFQLLVQLFFFLHLGQGKDAHWNVAIFISTAGIILILVIGSLWIMNHLNYNMSPEQMNNYIMHTEGMPK